MGALMKEGVPALVSSKTGIKGEAIQTAATSLGKALVPKGGVM